MRLDDHAFEQTARAVFIMNDSARERYETWEDLKSFMIGMAYQYGHGSTTSFSTGGFHLSFSKSNAYPDELYVTASVQAFTALCYAEKTIKELEAA